MGNFFEKIFGKKKQETVSNNINSQNNINNQDTTNQNIIEPEQPITFNQNINVGNQTVNPLGFQPTSPTDNIQNNINNQEYNLNPQPITFNQAQQTPQQNEVINVIPTLGPTPNPTDPNQK